MNLVKKSAAIYVDSRFTTTKTRGELWSRSIFDLGYNNIYLCSSETIDISDKLWIKGTAKKDKPFFLTEDTQFVSN